MAIVRDTIDSAKAIIAVPIQAATSKSAQRAYLATALFALLGFALLGISTISFIVFYNLYVPKIGLERPLYLQFGDGHPYARTDLANSLTSNQPYDITLSLLLPRTASNIQAGNFMLTVALLPPTAAETAPIPRLQQLLDTSEEPIAQSRRPSILTYNSPIVDLAKTLSGLPLYTLGWKKQHEAIEVSIFEGVEFRRGASNIPNRVHVTIEADEKMQFYSATLKVHAKLHGLRWFLYNYKLTSFTIFTTTFFGVSITSMLIIYLIFSYGSETSGNLRPVKAEIKGEPHAEVESIKTGQQTPASIGAADEIEVKKEDLDSLETSDLAPLGGEADDEDEEDEMYGGSTSGFRDSGIGTGREDVRDKAGRRRKSYAR